MYINVVLSLNCCGILKAQDVQNINLSLLLYVAKNTVECFVPGWYFIEKLTDGQKGWVPMSATREIESNHIRARNFKQRHAFLKLLTSMDPLDSLSFTTSSNDLLNNNNATQPQQRYSFFNQTSYSGPADIDWFPSVSRRSKKHVSISLSHMWYFQKYTHLNLIVKNS